MADADAAKAQSGDSVHAVLDSPSKDEGSKPPAAADDSIVELDQSDAEDEEMKEILEDLNSGDESNILDALKRLQSGEYEDDATTDMFIPKCVEMLKQNNIKIKINAMVSTKELIWSQIDFTDTVQAEIGKYIEAVVGLLDEVVEDEELNLLLTRHLPPAISSLQADFPDRVEQHMSTFIKYLAKMTGQKDRELAHEAVQYWANLAEYKEMIDIDWDATLQPYLEMLITGLMQQLTFSPKDMPNLNQHLKARSEMNQERYPCVVQSSLTQVAVENLLMLYQKSVEPHIITRIQQRLAHDDWLYREAAITVLGIYGKLCGHGSSEEVRKLLPALCKDLDNAEPWMHHSVCVALIHFTGWLATSPQGKTHLPAVMAKICQLGVSETVKLQREALGLLCGLLEIADDDTLQPYIDKDVIPMIKSAYDSNNTHIPSLCDAVGAVVDKYADYLDNLGHMDSLIQPLVKRWQEITSTSEDTHVVFLASCLGSIAKASKKAVQPHLNDLFKNTAKHLSDILLTKRCDPEACDCMTGLVNLNIDILDVDDGKTLLSQIEPLKMVTLILACTQRPYEELQEVAVSAMGELYKYDQSTILPHLSGILSILDVIFARTYQMQAFNSNLLTNAVLFLGLLASKGCSDPKPLHFIEHIVYLVKIPVVKRHLKENLVLTLCNMGSQWPDKVKQKVHHFIKPCCEILCQPFAVGVARYQTLFSLCKLLASCLDLANQKKDDDDDDCELVMDKCYAGIVEQDWLRLCHLIPEMQQDQGNITEQFQEVVTKLKSSMSENDWTDLTSQFSPKFQEYAKDHLKL